MKRFFAWLFDLIFPPKPFYYKEDWADRVGSWEWRQERDQDRVR